MMGTMFGLLGGKKEPEQAESKRRYDRRSRDVCVCEIEKQSFPIINWSLGGLLITADERTFLRGQKADITVKFKIRNAILDLPLQGEVVRKNRGKIAFRFLPFGDAIQHGFQQVLDDTIARDFADSQMG